MPIIKRSPSTQGSDLLSTRKGTIAVAAGVALLAAVILIAFLNQYRSSVEDDGEAAKVLVASQLIPKGSTGDTLASQTMFRLGEVRGDQLQKGALTDPAAVRGKIAVQDVLPGQQLTATDFAPVRDAVQGRLEADHRAVAVPVDAVHGLIGPVRAGDRVDVFVGFNADSGGTSRALVKTLLNNILVLRAPSGGEEGGANEGTVVLRVPADMAPEVAFAADNGRLWLIGRPAAGAKELRPETVSIDSLLAGTKSLKVRNGGDR